METKALIIHRWDDVVFENRNKEYGAYAIRQAYTKRLMLGLGLTVSGMIVLLFLPQLFPHTVNTGGKINDLPWEVTPDPPPTVIPNERLKDRQVTKTHKKNIVPIVTRLQVENELEKKDVEGIDIGDDSKVGNGGIDDHAEFIEASPVVEPTPAIVDFAELMPAYEGGNEAMMKWIVKNIRYPSAPRRLGIEGTVFVKFIVNGDGSVSDAYVIKGIHPDCDREAIRVISKLPAWKGGRQGGRPVAVRMVLPIKFRLNQ